MVAGAPNWRSGILSEVGSVSKYVETGEIQKCVWNNSLVIFPTKTGYALFFRVQPPLDFPGQFGQVYLRRLLIRFSKMAWLSRLIQ